MALKTLVSVDVYSHGIAYHPGSPCFFVGGGHGFGNHSRILFLRHFFLTGIRRLHLVRDFIPLHVAPGSMAYGFLSILHNCSLWSFAHILSSSAPLSSLLEFHGHPGQRSHPQRSFLDPISSCPPSPPFAHTLTLHMEGASFTFQQRHHLYIPAPLEDQSHELEGKACAVYGKRPKKANCR